jgi:hypothetical protein
LTVEVFVQVTVVPTVIVIGSGTKRSADVIDTACVSSGPAGPAVPRAPATSTPMTAVAMSKPMTKGERRRIKPAPPHLPVIS